MVIHDLHECPPPFTEYGVIPAELAGLSNATIPDEKAGWLFKMRLQRHPFDDGLFLISHHEVGG
ncbi:hypothetical protein GCM10009113_01710 [Marinobacter szutsaonensis]